MYKFLLYIKQSSPKISIRHVSMFQLTYTGCCFLHPNIFLPHPINLLNFPFCLYLKVTFGIYNPKIENTFWNFVSKTFYDFFFLICFRNDDLFLWQSPFHLRKSLKWKIYFGILFPKKENMLLEIFFLIFFFLNSILKYIFGITTSLFRNVIFGKHFFPFRQHFW